jgi:hypothetical protein
MEETESVLGFSTLKFFLSQPIGLFLERTVVLPATKSLPRNIRSIVTRIWVYVWMLGAGRWWADAWVHAGMWNPEEVLIVWSPVRGLLKGQWITV